jgi:hypothetical protein
VEPAIVYKANVVKSILQKRKAAYKEVKNSSSPTISVETLEKFKIKILKSKVQNYAHFGIS